MHAMFDAVDSVVEDAKVTCSSEFLKSFEFANQESKLATASRLEKDILLHEERVKQLLLEGENEWLEMYRYSKEVSSFAARTQQVLNSMRVPQTTASTPERTALAMPFMHRILSQITPNKCMTWNAEVVSTEGFNENLPPYGVPLINLNYLLRTKCTVSVECLLNANFTETLNYMLAKEMKF